MRPSRGTIAMITLVVGAALVSGAGGAVAGVQIGTAQIKDGAVTTKKIRNNAVTDRKITKGAVTGPKLRSNAVTSAKIKNGSVGTADLAASARGSKVLHYVAADGYQMAPGTAIAIKLPGRWTPTAVRTSTWSVQLWNGSSVLPVPGEYGGTSYRFQLLGADGGAHLVIHGGNGGSSFPVHEIRVTRTLSTGVSSAG